MALDDLSKLQGSFGYRLCALYLPRQDKSGWMSEALRMLVEGLGEEWRNKATFDDVCMELELAGVRQAGTLRSVVLAGLGEEIAEEDVDAGNAIRWLAKEDSRLSVWAACACAREALKYVGKRENRPRLAIETAEAWVRGEATSEQAYQAAEAAWDAGINAGDSAARDAAHAARAAALAASATYATKCAADAANAANPYYIYEAMDEAEWTANTAGAAPYWTCSAYVVEEIASAKYYATMAAEGRRLISVIARSLQTFPVLLTAPE